MLIAFVCQRRSPRKFVTLSFFIESAPKLSSDRRTGKYHSAKVGRTCENAAAKRATVMFWPSSHGRGSPSGAKSPIRARSDANDGSEWESSKMFARNAPLVAGNGGRRFA